MWWLGFRIQPSLYIRALHAWTVKLSTLCPKPYPKADASLTPLQKLLKRKELGKKDFADDEVLQSLGYEKVPLTGPNALTPSLDGDSRGECQCFHPILIKLNP